MMLGALTCRRWLRTQVAGLGVASARLKNAESHSLVTASYVLS